MNPLFSAFVGARSGMPVFDNTRRLARLFYRAHYYRQIAASALGHIPISTMLRSHFTFALPEAAKPAHLTIEFTNHCNLRCTYCTNPLHIRGRGLMHADTFELLVRQLREFGLSRVRVVGNGEPTLHPKFPYMIRELGRVCTYLQLVTNGQHLGNDAIEAILEAPVRLVEISADSDSKEEYEASRLGARLDDLLATLKRLRDRKRELRAPTLISIRAMIRPSQLAREHAILEFWRRRADSAMAQYVHDYTKGSDPNVFPHRQATGEVPRCAVPAKAMILHWNGTVPLCELSQRQTGQPDGIIVGDIRSSTLQEIWQSPLFQQYRSGHRDRRPELTPMCQGCIGG